MKTHHSFSRRSFVKTTAFGTGFAALSGSAMALTACENPPQRKLGIALVGLGNYATNNLAPALQETQYCELRGIVTGTPEKAEKWKAQYNIPESNIYNYDNYDQIADNPDIDIVYVVLPNSMHAEYSIRASQAGKHVICEKPMAISVKECEDMIAAAKAADKQLAIGYRLQYEANTLEMMRLGQEAVYGKVKLIEAGFGFRLDNPERWRMQKALAGGGPMMDVGIYVIQGACYVTGEVPVAVTAQAFKTQPDIYKDIEETLLWQMEFPGGAAASCTTSYACNMERLRANAERGWFELSPAYGYGPLKGKTHEGPLELPHRTHQAVHMDAISKSILEGKPNTVPGEMGLRDMKIIEAVYRAMETGERVETGLV